MAEKSHDPSIVALDVHSDTKGEVYNADDLRLQQMGLSCLFAEFNMQLIMRRAYPGALPAF